MKTTLTFLIVLAGMRGYAQQPAADTAFIAQAVRNVVSIYDKFIEGQQLYYSGSLYAEPARTNETHAYFLTDEWSLETLTFDGENFARVPLLYDISRDMLITESVAGNMQVIPGQRVNNFRVQGHYFERLSPEDYHGSLPRTGFYEILYDGKTKVISLRQKLVQEKVDQNKIQLDYYEKRRYYVLLSGKYVQVKSKKALIDLLADRKTDLRTFAKRNKVVFKRNLERALPAIAKQYDSITVNQK